MTKTGSVTLTHNEQIVVATIDDGKANALSPEVVSALRSAVAAAVNADATLVVAGRPGYFCAGFDLSIMNGDDPDAKQALIEHGLSLVREMLAAPVPVVLACTGHALAAGALLLLGADHRVGATGDFRIGLNEVAAGMALPESAVTLAHHRLRAEAMTAATMFARTTGPEQALMAGFLDGLADDALMAALAVAEEFGALPHTPFARTKARVRKRLLVELG